MAAFTRVFTLMGVAATLVATSPVWAEAAPVYDADTMQQQFESAGEVAQVPEPPPPAAVQDGTFMPVPAAPSTAAAVPAQPAEAANAAPSSPSGNLGSIAAMSPDQRLKRVEQQLNALQSNELGARTESLQGQVQALRGQVEQLTHQVEQLQAQQKSQYSDLDNRLKAAPAPSSASNETPAATPATPATPAKAKGKTAAKAETQALIAAASTTPKAASAKAEPDVAEEQKIYQTAYDLIKAKKYSQAVTTLQGMLQKYPSGQFASNAHYWLGELYGLLGKNDQALVEFATVVKSFPDSPRVSDSQLKVGLIYAAQNQWPDAKLAFKKVATNYSGTASARLAAEQLKQLKQAGH